MGFFNFKKKQKQEPQQKEAPNINEGFKRGYKIGALHSLVQDFFDGDKFPGGFGITKDFVFIDYQTLRTRSSQLHRENNYFQGLVNRLVTNEVNTGLTLEATPEESILGFDNGDDEEFLQNWTNGVEVKFSIYGENKRIVDYKELSTLGDLERIAKETAIFSGDCLIILRQNKKTGLPNVQIIDGANIETPLITTKVANGHTIKDGVELDSRGRQVAYWVQIEESGRIKTKRIRAKGEKSGRRVAWLYYGGKRRINETRGMPLLSALLQMLKELDRYKDAELRAAVINGLLPLFIEKSEDRISTLPMSGGAVRKSTAVVQDSDGGTRDLEIVKEVPGLIMQNLAKGEKPVSFSAQRPNVNYKSFETAMVDAIGWAVEVPPEILRLFFTSSFSAARQANNEFNVYLKKARKINSGQFNQPIYEEWLLSMTLLRLIDTPGLLQAWRKKDWLTLGAWYSTLWIGLSRPSIDINKDVDAQIKMINQGLTTHERAARGLNGSSFTKNIKKLKKELETSKGILFEEEQQGEESLLPGEIDEDGR